MASCITAPAARALTETELGNQENDIKFRTANPQQLYELEIWKAQKPSGKFRNSKARVPSGGPSQGLCSSLAAPLANVTEYLKHVEHFGLYLAVVLLAWHHAFVKPGKHMCNLCYSLELRNLSPHPTVSGTVDLKPLCPEAFSHHEPPPRHR